MMIRRWKIIEFYSTRLGKLKKQIAQKKRTLSLAPQQLFPKDCKFVGQTTNIHTKYTKFKQHEISLPLTIGIDDYFQKMCEHIDGTF